VTYASTLSALDAVDNMHRNVLPGPSNGSNVLKVNLAKAPKGQGVSGSNRASKSLSLIQWVVGAAGLHQGTGDERMGIGCG
jgi:hypothetical protein